MEKLTGKKRREGPLRRKESRGGDIEEEGGQSIVFFLVVVTLRHEEEKEKYRDGPKTYSWYISAFRGYPLFFTVSSHESEEEKLAWRRKKSEGKLG